MIKVYFKEDGFWYSNGCDCCESIYLDAWAFSHTEGVDDYEQYERCAPEMYNGAKSSRWSCLVSVFWDLVVDQEQYEDYYEMCRSFDDIDEDSILNVLSDKGIEVVFISEEDDA